MGNDKDSDFYKNILDLVPEPILVLEVKDLSVRYVNLEFQIQFEKSSSFFKKKKIDQIFNQNSFLISNLKKMSKKTGMFLIKEAALFKNFSYEVRCIVNETYNDQILMVFKKSTKSQFFNQDQFIIFDETFSILSHEINNPLSSIKMASQLILKSKKYDEELHKIVVNETERISKIFKSLSYINTKNSLLDGSNENIHEIIRYSVFRLKEKNIIKIIEDFDPSLPMIRIDKNAMVQVFDNLLLNSIDATANKDNAYIKLSTKFLYGQSIKIPNLKNQIKKNYLQIIFEDNGIGINPNDLDKIFIPFFTKKKKGSGIGLFLVKKIIDYHNGEISIKIEDNCTKVYIKLPL